MTGTNGWKPSSVAEWERNSLLQVTLTSGTRVTLRRLTLDELAGLDGLPEDLLRVALLEQTPGGVVGEITARLRQNKPADLKVASDLSKANLELRDRIVLAAVVEPKLTKAKLAKLDPFDRDEIANFAQRRLNVDATGKRVGADALDSFREGCRILARSETDEARKALLLELADVQ